MNRKQIDVIEQNVTIQEVLALHGIRAKRNRCRCPFHASRPDTFSFTDRLYHCFSCGESGGPIQLEAKLSGVTDDEALHILADRFGTPTNSAYHVGVGKWDKPSRWGQGI